jgi:GT2 family glycosyltransferase
VAITIVSHECAADLPRMLASVAALAPAPAEVVAVDNGSRDGSADLLRRSPLLTGFRDMGGNLGFAGGQNAAIRETRAEIVLCLNPDAILAPDFLAEATRPFQDGGVGMVSGKLRRSTAELQVPEGGAVIDSTGIVWTRSGRHLDRGAGEPDRGQYDRDEEVFGPSGAAGLYRRSMLEDVAVDGQYFDEDFHSYREDADLAWRARLLGHRGAYAFRALAHHRRRVTPERRASLSPYVNYHSVKNRFLLRLKNEGLPMALRHAPWELSRDLMVIGYVLLREPRSVPALGEVVRLLPRTLAKRRQIQGRRRVPDAELLRWFGMARG